MEWTRMTDPPSSTTQWITSLPPLHQQLKHLSPLFLVRMSPRIIRSRRSTRGVNRSTTEARLQYARVRLAVQSSRK